MNMFIHYVKGSTRNIVRHKIFSLINIIGLAIGMFVCLNLMMLVTDHMMFDQYNTKRHLIYRVFRDSGPGTNDKATVPLPIRSEFVLMEKTSIPVAGLFADAEVFEVFEYELEYVDPKTALIEPFTVVLKK